MRRRSLTSAVPEDLQHYDRAYWEGIAIAAGDYDAETRRLAVHARTSPEGVKAWADWDLLCRFGPDRYFEALRSAGVDYEKASQLRAHASVSAMRASWSEEA